MSQNSNQDNTLKTLGIVTLSVIVFALIYNTLPVRQTGWNYQWSYGGGNGNTLISSTLVLFVKLLWLVLVASLVIGLVVIIKKYLFDGEKLDLSFLVNNTSPDISNKTGEDTESEYNCPCCGAVITDDQKICHLCQANRNETCINCVKEIQTGWKYCAACGTETKPANEV